eukprot:m.676592 g.676592  ORF g.676592 m.676592 type:complete len:839 (-) comp58563_c0_seq13:137-2653(-)
MSHQRQQPQQQLAARQQSTVSQQQHFPPQHQQQSMQQKLAQQETLKDTTQRITQVVTSLKHELETRTKELQVASQHLQEKTEQGRQLKAQMQQVQGQNEQLKNRITELQRKEADVTEGVSTGRQLAEALKKRVVMLSGRFELGETGVGAIRDAVLKQDATIEDLLSRAKQLKEAEAAQFALFQKQYEDTLEAKNRRLNALTEETGRTKADLQALQEQFRSLQGQYALEKDRWAAEIAHLNATSQQEGQQARAREKELEGSAASLKNEVANLRVKQELLEASVKMQEQENLRSREALAEKAVKLEQMEQQLKENAIQIAKHFEESVLLKAERVQLTSELAATKDKTADEIRKLQSELEAREDQLKKESTARSEQAAEIAALKLREIRSTQTERDLQADVASLRDEAAKSQETFAAKEAVLEALAQSREVDKATLRERLAALQSSFEEEKARMLEQSEARQTNLEQCRAQMHALASDYSAQIISLKQATAQAEAKFSELERHQALTTERAEAELRELKEKLASEQSKSFVAEEEVQRCRFELSIVKDQIGDTDKTHAHAVELERKLAELEASKSTALAELQKKVEKEAHKSAQEFKLVIQAAKIESAKSLESRDQTIGRLEAENSRLKSQVDTLSKDIDELKAPTLADARDFKLPRKLISHQTDVRDAVAPKTPKTPKRATADFGASKKSPAPPTSQRKRTQKDERPLDSSVEEDQENVASAGLEQDSSEPVKRRGRDVLAQSVHARPGERIAFASKARKVEPSPSEQRTSMFGGAAKLSSRSPAPVSARQPSSAFDFREAAEPASRKPGLVSMPKSLPPKRPSEPAAQAWDGWFSDSEK